MLSSSCLTCASCWKFGDTWLCAGVNSCGMKVYGPCSLMVRFDCVPAVFCVRTNVDARNATSTIWQVKRLLSASIGKRNDASPRTARAYLQFTLYGNQRRHSSIVAYAPVLRKRKSFRSDAGIMMWVMERGKDISRTNAWMTFSSSNWCSSW